MRREKISSLMAGLTMRLKNNLGIYSAGDQRPKYHRSEGHSVLSRRMPDVGRGDININLMIV